MAELTYPQAVARFAAASAALDAERGTITAWYEQQCSAALEAVERAADLVDDAQQEVDAAREAVRRVDAESALLWRSLRARVDRRTAARLEDLPVPASPDPAPDPAPAVATLRQVRELLDGVPAVQVMSAWLYPVLATIGAALGAGTGLLVHDRPLYQRIAVGVAATVLAVVPARVLAGLGGARLEPVALALALAAGAISSAAVLLW